MKASRESQHIDFPKLSISKIANLTFLLIYTICTDFMTGQTPPYPLPTKCKQSLQLGQEGKLERSLHLWLQ